jgi:hypothetical protein
MRVKQSGFLLLESLLVLSLFVLIAPVLSQNSRACIRFIHQHYTKHLVHLEQIYVFDALHEDIQYVADLTRIQDNDYVLTLLSGTTIRYTLNKGRLGRSYDGKRRHYLTHVWDIQGIEIKKADSTLSLSLSNSDSHIELVGSIL